MIVAGSYDDFKSDPAGENHLPLNADLWEPDGSGSNKPLMRSCTGLDRLFHLGCFSSEMPTANVHLMDLHMAPFSQAAKSPGSFVCGQALINSA